MNAIAAVEDEVRELVRRRGLDPVADPAAVRRLVDEVITDYDERSVGGTLPQLLDARVAARQVFDAVAGFGPLQKYLDDPTVEEIWINEPTKVFIARRGVHELTTTILTARRGARPGREDAEVLGPAGRPVHAVRRRDAARRLPAARRDPGHHPAALVGQRPQVRRPGHPSRRPRPARHADHAVRAVPRGGRLLRAQRPRVRRHPGRQDHAAQLPRLRRSRRGSGWSPARRSSS